MKRNRFKIIALSAILISTISFSGCGGSSANNEDNTTLSGVEQETTFSGVEQETTLRGTVALGNGAEADITLIGSAHNTIEGRSTSDGSYSIDASGLTQPIMIRAVLDATGSMMYSFAQANSGVVNVTPLTTFVVDQAAQASGVTGGASQLFSRFEEGTAPSQDALNIDAQEERLNQVIETTMANNGVENFDHFHGEFDANHEGYDALLDALDIEIYQDDIIIREGDQTLDTVNYDITTSEINASGNIYDIATNQYIENATINLIGSEDYIKTINSDENGSFTATIETMRTYDINISADGYLTQYIPNVSSFIFNDLYIGEIPMIPVGESSTTLLSGTVIDGRTTNSAIANTTLNFRSGFENRVEDPLLSTVTDENGTYELTIPAGVYTVEMKNENYYTKFVDIIVYGSQSTESFSMLSNLANTTTDFFATISLNWDSNPSDLDSHLTGPAAGEDARFHLYYSNRIISTSTTNSEDEMTELYRSAMEEVTGHDYSGWSEDDLQEEYYNLSDEDMIAVDELVSSNYIDDWSEAYRDALEEVTGDDYSTLHEDELDEIYYALSDEQMSTVDAIMENYYSQESVHTPCTNGEVASLDRDRTDDYIGLYPETTTICSTEPNGLYKYYVHHFYGEGTMSEGHAQVTVSTANGASRTFNAPATDSQGENDIWHVFNIDADGNIYPVNEIIGNDYDNSSLFAAPSFKKDAHFYGEKGLIDNLPRK